MCINSECRYMKLNSVHCEPLLGLTHASVVPSLNWLSERRLGKMQFAQKRGFERGKASPLLSPWGPRGT